MDWSLRVRSDSARVSQSLIEQSRRGGADTLHFVVAPVGKAAQFLHAVPKNHKRGLLAAGQAAFNEVFDRNVETSNRVGVH